MGGSSFPRINVKRRGEREKKEERERERGMERERDDGFHDVEREGRMEKEKRRKEKSACKEKFFRDTMRLITIGHDSSFSFIPLGRRIKVTGGNFQFNAGER